jgi:hypothetical protein
VREWLSAQAAQGYVTYDKSAQKFSLSPEQAMVFADDESPFFMAGFFDIATDLFSDVSKIVNAFRSNGALAWHEHNDRLFCGTQRIFRPAYNHSLVKEWLPALDGVVAKLAWLHGRICRVWAWCFHHSDDESLSQFEILRLRLSSGIDRSRTDIGARSRHR